MRYFRSIGQFAREAGWHLETRHFFGQSVPDKWQGDGLIMSDTKRPDLLAFLKKQSPLQSSVFMGSGSPGINAPSVIEDNRAAGMLAGRHFLERGHRHYAWFAPDRGPVAIDRLEGYRSTLAEAGFDCRILEPPVGANTEAWLVKRLRSLPRPLACFCLDDEAASDLIQICVAQGWRVPEEVAVMGLGNIEIACECSHVPISSIDVNEEEVGRRAAMLLDDLMRGRRAPSDPIVIPPRRVVTRQSTDFHVVTEPALSKAMRYIHHSLHRPLSMDQIAAAAGISRRTLYRIFERNLHRTPPDYLLQARLSHARNLLSHPAETPKSVSRQCGLSSLRALNRLFRIHEKTTALMWQAEHASRSD